MKLVTLKNGKLGRVDGEQVIPFDFAGGMLGLITAANDGLTAAKAASGAAIALAGDGQLAAPLDNPSKIMAIGKNYADHALETKSKIPERPIVFTKFTTSIIGPGELIQWDPALTQKVDFEAELAVIIGKKARHVAQANALDYVFGYTCANDVSARDLQYGDGQWVRGKSLDTFCPLGPWIVTADDLPDPQNLTISFKLNGQTMQHSHTSKMIFNVVFLISFLSQAFTLRPGDIILTGTPDGVGVFREPPILLGDGDETLVELEGIGQLVNRCRTATA